MSALFQGAKLLLHSKPAYLIQLTGTTVDSFTEYPGSVNNFNSNNTQFNSIVREGHAAMNFGGSANPGPILQSTVSGTQGLLGTTNDATLKTQLQEGLTASQQELTCYNQHPNDYARCNAIKLLNVILV